MNNLALASALATAPSTAFAELRERPRFWFPLLILTFVAAGTVYWYYSMVDVEWLKDTLFSNNPNILAMPEDKRAAALGAISRNTLLLSSVIGTLIFIPVYFLIEALYLWVAAKVTKLPQGFKHWFALSCWSALPLLIGSVVAAIFLIMSDTAQISPSVLQPLSLNELLFHRPIGSPGQGLLESLSIPAFLSWMLMIIGVHTWSQRSWVFSSVLVLLPLVCLYGGWALFAFR